MFCFNCCSSDDSVLVLAVEQHLPGTVKFPVYVHEPHLLLMGKSMRICKIFSSVQTCGRNRFCYMPDNALAEMLRLLQSPLAGVSSPVWAGLGLVAGQGRRRGHPPGRSRHRLTLLGQTVAGVACTQLCWLRSDPARLNPAGEGTARAKTSLCLWLGLI